MHSRIFAFRGGVAALQKLHLSVKTDVSRNDDFLMILSDYFKNFFWIINSSKVYEGLTFDARWSVAVTSSHDLP